MPLPGFEPETSAVRDNDANFYTSAGQLFNTSYRQIIIVELSSISREFNSIYILRQSISSLNRGTEQENNIQYEALNFGFRK